MKPETKKISITGTETIEMRFANSNGNLNSAILILPALGVAAISYDRLLLKLSKAGYSCATIDLRGQGNSSVKANRNCNYGYKDLLTKDIPAAITEVNQQFGKPVTILGHSLGGQLACLYSTSKDESVNGLILCTSGSVYYKSWGGFERLKVLCGSQFARSYAWVAGYFPGNKFGFGDRTFQKLINDWGRQALTGNYNIAGLKTDFEQEMVKVKLPILVLSLREDFLAPPKAVKYLTDKFSSANITRYIIEDPVLNHFNWLKNSNEFVERISNWLS